MTKVTAEKSQWYIPVLIGFFACMIVLGPRILDPTNIAWLGTGDPVQHYLGWSFFRNSDWSLPLGLNPRFGLEISNAVVFSDSNPLFAILFKVISPWLPETFQYFGFWLLLCFVLQAYFGWKLAALLTPSPTLRALVCLLFVFSPPMFLRMQGHLSLSGHFLILAGVYLTFLPELRRRRTAWGLLLGAAILVHAYLFAMVATLWIADAARRRLNKELTTRQVAIETGTFTLMIALLMWLAGYFSVGKGAVAGGYGYFRMNLASLFDPDGWSYVLSDIPGGPGDYEGFNYLGLGLVLLFGVALVRMLDNLQTVRSVIRTYPTLLIALIGLTLLATTNQMGFATHNFGFPIPHFFEKMANIFRASGRMFWPVFYVIVFAILYAVIRTGSKPVAIALVAIAVVLQVSDTKRGWAVLRSGHMAEPSSTWTTDMRDPFWDSAAKQYKNVRWIMPANSSEHWATLSYYASTHGMGTDAVYLARVGTKAMAKSQKEAQSILATGQYQADSLYVLDETSAKQAMLSIDQASDTLAKVDGMYVVAPGWKRCSECSPFGEEHESISMDNTQRAGDTVMFTSAVAGRLHLTSGWAASEAWGTWSEGKEATLNMRIQGKVSKLVFQADALVGNLRSKQQFTAQINNGPVQKIELEAREGNTFELMMPQSSLLSAAGSPEKTTVNFKFLTPATPQELGMGDGDNRQLAIGLRNLRLE